MLPDIPLDFVKEVSQMFMDYIVSVTLVNKNLSCTTAGPGLVIITIWWSLSESCTTLDRLMTSDKPLNNHMTSLNNQ